MKYDYLIVGAGLFGATFAWRARQAGKTCLVIDRREHTGGNTYCEQVEGINVHRYGAHIFHTNNEEIWRFVNSLVPFNRYTNSPVANYQGKLYNLPFNMNTFYQMWGVKTPAEAAAKIEEQRAEARQLLQQQGVAEPCNLEEQALLLIGRDIYEKLIKGYTEKQWGRACTELPAFIIRRLPVRFVFDNNYFNDRFQGIPEGGYNVLINKLLEGCDVRLGVDYLENREAWNEQANQIVYTGEIDRYFDYRLGHLEWRTVRFETETMSTSNYQGNAVVNYTEREIPYTRIIEHKHFESFGADVDKNPKTVISREYSTEWHLGMEPYYPVNDEKNDKLYKQYVELANAEKNVLFGGRLAEYKYYDMAPTMERAFAIKID
ncbi:UDP-galactopyranose mutase [Prevotellaceae bacterium HUN156]|nr:UDP-galactopyranose mutase [Prevotellaceae bacterium HUN156]